MLVATRSVPRLEIDSAHVGSAQNSVRIDFTSVAAFEYGANQIAYRY